MLTSSAADPQEVPLPPGEQDRLAARGTEGRVWGGGVESGAVVQSWESHVFFYYYPIGRYQCDTTEFLLS
jgi:hypothetical protein